MEDKIGQAVAQEIGNQAQAAAENASVGFMQRIFDAYNSFISMFPEAYQWIVSVILVLAIAAFLWNLVKKNWLWLILVVILFPGLLPILQNIFNSLAAMFTGQPTPSS